MDGLIFGVVVASRVLVPLAIPRFPLPAMLAALVIDGIDQTIFQTFTSLDLTGYQSYDKALDVYYLSIAYVATLRNWTHLAAFGVSRFLYYYRLVGVVLFELTQVRAVLLVFPNTFEYFFDFYEAVRVRWDPLRMSTRLRHRSSGVHLDLHQAAPGVVDPRRAAGRDRHDQDRDLRRQRRFVLDRRDREPSVGGRR